MYTKSSRFWTGMVTGSMIGAFIGASAYRSMSPKQKRAVEKNLRKAVDQVSDIVDNMQEGKIF